MAKPFYKQLVAAALMIFSLLLASAPAGAVPAQNSTAPSGSNVASATRPEDSGPKALGADNHFLREGNATAETDISGAGAVSGEIPPHNSTALGSSSPNEPETPIFSWGGYFKGIGALFLILAALWGVVWFLRRRGSLPGLGGLPRGASCRCPAVDDWGTPRLCAAGPGPCLS